MASEYFYTFESAEIKLGKGPSIESRFFIDLKSSSPLPLLLISIPFRISEDFLESDINVRREMELLEPSDPDCMVKKESLELLELRLLGELGDTGDKPCPSVYEFKEPFFDTVLFNPLKNPILFYYLSDDS